MRRQHVVGGEANHHGGSDLAYRIAAQGLENHRPPPRFDPEEQGENDEKRHHEPVVGSGEHLAQRLQIDLPQGIAKQQRRDGDNQDRRQPFFHRKPCPVSARGVGAGAVAIL